MYGCEIILIPARLSDCTRCSFNIAGGPDCPHGVSSPRGPSCLPLVEPVLDKGDLLLVDLNNAGRFKRLVAVLIAVVPAVCHELERLLEGVDAGASICVLLARRRCWAPWVVYAAEIAKGWRGRESEAGKCEQGGKQTGSPRKHSHWPLIKASRCLAI